MAEPHSRYGPHDPSTVPLSGRRFGPGHRSGKRTDIEAIPYPPILARQRAQVNGLAHGDDLAGLRSALCRVCAFPEWQCLSMRRGVDDPHEYEPSR